MKCENCGKEVDKVHKWASIQQEARKTFCCSRECSIALTKRWNTQDAVRTLLADEEFMENLAIYITGIGGWKDYRNYLTKALRNAAEKAEEAR